MFFYHAQLHLISHLETTTAASRLRLDNVGNFQGRDLIEVVELVVANRGAVQPIEVFDFHNLSVDVTPNKVRGEKKKQGQTAPIEQFSFDTPNAGRFAQKAFAGKG